MKQHPINEILRKRAVEQDNGDVPVADTSLSEMDVQALLHELQVHQIELELQNEELQLAQAEVKAALEQYQNLFDYAPVGYFNFDHDGSIQKINLTGAAMLKAERSLLIGRRFQLFLTDETRDVFADFLEKVFRTTTRQACEVALHMEGDQPVFVRIEAEASDGNQLCLAAVTDITEFKQVMELKESRKQYRALAESTSAIAWEFDIRRDRWTYVAPQVQRILGYASEEWRDFAWWQERLHPDDREWVSAYFRKLFTGCNEQGFEYRFVTKEGRSVWLNTIVNVEMRDNKPVVMRGIMLDISGQKRSVEERAALTVQQEGVNLLLQSLLKPAPLETKLKDITDGIVQYFNADFSRIWLIRPGDLCDQGCVHAEAPDGAHVCRHRDKCLHLLASSGRYTHINGKVHSRVPFGCYKIGRVAAGDEHKFLTNDVENDPRIHDHEWAQHLGLVSFAGYQLKVPGGEPIGVLALFSKHTILPSDDAMLDGLSSAVALTVQQASAENELCLAKDYNRSLIEASLDPLVTISPVGEITDVNSATEKVTGYSREELIGYDFSDYFTEPEKARAGYQQAFRDGAVRDYPLQILNRDGHKTSVMYNASVFRDGNGELIGVFAAARDITEQKKLEAQLFHAQKMEAIGQLAGGIAHDFNNILTGIIGFSTLIEMSMDKDDPQREYLNHILVAADRAADLTKSLLAFSRKQIINPQPIDLNLIINKTEKFLKRIIGEDIALKTITHEDELTVHADSGQIEQVFMNLATNARDAMPHGGTLGIETSAIEINADFIKNHGYGEPGEYALVSISDNGMGMDDITCKRLFEPFFTTKELGKGTGLGLSIVYGIVKQHNGYINVYSEPGVGTIFTIYLPLLKADISHSTDQVEEILTGGTETLLVADDDAMVLSLAEKILEQFGYTVITANDGLDAVDKFSGNRDRIALVILDVIMPNMNGKEALDEIRKICPEMKALFISGYTADIIHKRGTLDESLEFLTKPLRPMNLLLKVRDVLDGTKLPVKSGVES